MRTSLLLFLTMFAFATYGNDITITNIKYNKSTTTVSFDLAWKNGWKNKKNHDAAWLFIKIPKSDGYEHGLLSAKGHKISTKSGAKAVLTLPSDKVGVFVAPSQHHRGNVSYTLSLKLSKPVGSNVIPEVYAIEMVYIPKSSYYIGSTDPKAVAYASFYTSDESGNPSDVYQINAQDQVIQVGPNSGQLYYRVGRSPYRGDMKGTIPASFPKGFEAFYMMKYETTQGLYVDFLNSISASLAAQLNPIAVEEYHKKKGSMYLESDNYIAKSRNRPANFITWDEGAAMADWAGLRPMTELEFTKAARGPEKPIVHDYPWGTDNTSLLKRKVELNDELILADGILEKNLSDKNRAVYGASYYWVMDLAGSLWEKCVTIGHPIGRSFLGTHGDGVISDLGTATNEDWPKGIKEEGGYGYRGGGYYHHGMKISDYNPHSPVAYRPYGSWAGGKRSIAYSQRYVRTAD